MVFDSEVAGYGQSRDFVSGRDNGVIKRIHRWQFDTMLYLQVITALSANPDRRFLDTGINGKQEKNPFPAARDFFGNRSGRSLVLFESDNAVIKELELLFSIDNAVISERA